MSPSQTQAIAKACPHLRVILQRELEAGNLVEWIDIGGSDTVIKLRGTWVRAHAIAATPLDERVVADPHWWGRELHCPVHHQRLVSPL